ncbi:MAG: NAD(+)/NADH kinase [Candidatus Cryptobacteroides sp.]
MRAAYYIKKKELACDEQIKGLVTRLSESGIEVYNIDEGLRDHTDLLLSFGGDGTFLSAAHLVCSAGVPVLGVNLGRLGFLSDAELQDVEEALISGNRKVESRTMIQANVAGKCFYAINEVALRRIASGTLGVDVKVDNDILPTYWADGLLVSTSTGSTAYSLSAGGPICSPELKAFIITPIAPHNLNLRPLVVPQEAVISMSAYDRKNRKVVLSIDNMDFEIPAGKPVRISCAPFPLLRVVTGKSSFIGALRSKLLWGEDVRNTH